mgnify:CR=1 FL=1
MTHSHDEYNSPFIKRIMKIICKNLDDSTKTKYKNSINDNWIPVAISLDYQFIKWFKMLQNILGFI